MSVPLVGFSVPAYAGNDLWWKYDYDAQTDDLLRRYTNLSDTGGIGYSIVDRYSEIKMHLYTNAHLTGPLQQAVDSGLIQIFPLN